jgi:outer membrane protein TolC
LEDKLLENQGDMQDKRVLLKNTQTLENLARLKAHESDVRYQSGEAPLTAVLESRKELLQAQKESLRRGLDYDKAVLQFRENSGDLGNSYVDAGAWQK